MQEAATSGSYRNARGYHHRIPGPVPSSSDPPVSTLRGARVDVDPRRAGRLLVVLALVSVAVAAAILLVAGVRNNDRITRFQQDGLPVQVTVAGCRGLLGGSGSNPVGYSCSGTFTVAGKRYSAGLPGDALLAPGTHVRLLTIADDPGPLATPAVVAREHPSARAYILPAVLFGLVAVYAGALVLRRRSGQPASRSLPGLGGGRRLGEAAGGV